MSGLKQPVPFLSFEVNLPEFREEGLRCIQSLGRVCPEGRFNFIADCECDLERGEWLQPTEFAVVFKECPRKCIEVFWKTPLNSADLPAEPV